MSASADFRIAPRDIVRIALAATLVILVAAIWWWLGPAGRGAASGFLQDADQQGQRLYGSGAFKSAAERFVDPRRQATAWYRAGEFEKAAGIYAGLNDAQAAYNHGNALVMLGQYEQAMERYDAALQVRPGWEAAAANRELARYRAERVETKGGDMTGGELAPDEIRLDEGGSKNGGEKEVTQGGGSDAELRAVWLRRVQTEPADFLRAKFAYQQARRDSQ